MENFYHLIESADWAKAKEIGRLEPESLSAEGFIHCSFLHQLQTTANRFYPDANELLALELNADSLGEELIIEDTSGHGEFPHVYRALEMKDIGDVHQMQKADNKWHTWR